MRINSIMAVAEKFLIVVGRIFEAVVWVKVDKLADAGVGTETIFTFKSRGN